MTRITLALAFAIVALAPIRAHAQARVAHGYVTRADSHGPLAFSIVSVVGSTIERFADDSGRFTLADLPPGAVHLLVRHIGFAPREVVLSGDSTVHVELDPIAVSLAVVTVEADRECLDPRSHTGENLKNGDSSLAVAVNQIVENGREYRLVTQSYPFTITMRQVYAYNTAAGDEQISDRASRINSTVHWDYHPGEIVTRKRFSTAYAMNVPTIAVFAEPAFIQSHCFSIDSVTRDSLPLLVVSFRAAATIRDPDVDGAIYLDSKTFVIRRSLLHVSHISRQIDEFDSISVETHFEEVYPGVPIVTSIDGVDHYASPFRGRNGTFVRALIERQRVTALDFNHGEPGDSSHHGLWSSQHRELDRIVAVVDDSTGKPIVGATVRDAAANVAWLTGKEGTVNLAFVRDDWTVIQVTAPGYLPVKFPVQLSLRRLPAVSVPLHRVH